MYACWTLNARKIAEKIMSSVFNTHSDSSRTGTVTDPKKIPFRPQTTAIKCQRTRSDQTVAGALHTKYDIRLPRWVYVRQLILSQQTCFVSRSQTSLNQGSQHEATTCLAHTSHHNYHCRHWHHSSIAWYRYSRFTSLLHGPVSKDIRNRICIGKWDCIYSNTNSS